MGCRQPRLAHHDTSSAVYLRTRPTSGSSLQKEPHDEKGTQYAGDDGTANEDDCDELLHTLAHPGAKTAYASVFGA